MISRNKPVLELDDYEREAVVDLLRAYAAMHEDLGYGVDSGVELRAALANDPTFAYSPEAIERAVANEERRLERLGRASAAYARPFRELGNQVDRNGTLNLSNASTCGRIAETIDYAGWTLHDEYAHPPKELRRVVEAIELPPRPHHNHEARDNSQAPCGQLRRPMAGRQAGLPGPATAATNTRFAPEGTLSQQDMRPNQGIGW